MRIFTLILPIFYFAYWLIYQTNPFSLVWFVIIYIALFLFEMLIASILKGSSKIIKEKSISIDKQIKEFDRRLKVIEEEKMRENK